MNSDKRSRREKAKHRQGRHRRGGKRWKERDKLRVEGEGDGAGTVDLGYVLHIGWALLSSVCFYSIFTVQSGH